MSTGSHEEFYTLEKTKKILFNASLNSIFHLIRNKWLMPFVSIDAHYERLQFRVRQESTKKNQDLYFPDVRVTGEVPVKKQEFALIDSSPNCQFKLLGLRFRGSYNITFHFKDGRHKETLESLEFNKLKIIRDITFNEDKWYGEDDLKFLKSDIDHIREGKTPPSYKEQGIQPTQDSISVEIIANVASKFTSSKGGIGFNRDEYYKPWVDYAINLYLDNPALTLKELLKKTDEKLPFLLRDFQPKTLKAKIQEAIKNLPK